MNKPLRLGRPFGNDATCRIPVLFVMLIVQGSGEGEGAQAAAALARRQGRFIVDWPEPFLSPVSPSRSSPGQTPMGDQWQPRGVYGK